MKYDVLLASIVKKGITIPDTLLAFDPGETISKERVGRFNMFRFAEIGRILI